MTIISVLGGFGWLYESAKCRTTTRMSAIRELLGTWGPAWLMMIADVDAASILTAAGNVHAEDN